MKSRSKRSPQASHASISPARKRLFTAVLLLTPVLFFLILEIILRAISYGPDLSLFTTETIGGKTYHIMNPMVKARYFHRVDFSPNTSMDYFQVPKAPNTFRIFCLGGSTTVGFPYGYIGSFSSFMRDRLQAVFLDKQIELINVGLTATNSYTVLDMAQELVDSDPDLFIVYDGHNEFYGALGAASHESAGPSRWMTNLYLRLIHFKTFLLMRDGIGFAMSLFHTAGAEEQEEGTMMERLARGQYVQYRSDEYNRTLQTFEQNLGDLKNLCLQHDIPLILGSQVSNERDLEPFVSQNDSRLTPSERLQFNEILNNGMAFWMEGKIDSAGNKFGSAIEIDSMNAEAAYWNARCLDSLKNRTAARGYYRRARDLDLLRFRASTDFNNALANMNNGKSVIFVDMENFLAGYSPDSLVGNTLILEHLHPNLRGYFLLGKAYVSAIRTHEMIAPAEVWKDADTLSDEWFWDHKSITELDQRAAERRIEVLTSNWPFTDTPKKPREFASDNFLEQVIDQLLNGKTTWEQAHVSAAQYYESRNELEKSEKEYFAIMRQIPKNISAYLILSQLYLRKRKNDAAREILLASLDVERTAYANKALGAIAVDAGKPQDALPYLKEAYMLSSTDKERYENAYLLALAYNRLNRRQEAIAQLENVLRLQPSFSPARELLNRLTARK